METQRESGCKKWANAPRDNAGSTRPSPPPMGSVDAQGTSASLDALTFDSSFSFLDNIDDLTDSMMALLDTDAVASEPAPLVEEPLIATASSETATNSPLNGDMTAKIKLEETALNGASKPPTATATTRARQKEELEYLRSQVVELEAELAQLKSAPESPSTPAEPSVWEKIAKRQIEEKQKAAVENAKLRELLEGHLKVARSLEKLLNKRALCEPDMHLTERKRLRTTEDVDLSAVVEEIRGRIHSQFDDVDTVMDECGLSLIYTDVEDAHATVRMGTDDGICMEMMMVKVLPFPVAQVGDVVWQCTSARRIELDNGFFGSSRRTESTCDLQFAVKVYRRRAEAVVHVRGVGAHRTEANRSLIVFESTGWTQGKLFEHHPINCRERGYIAIENNEVSADSDGSPSTIVKVCVRLWPESDKGEGEKAGADHHFKSFVDLVIGSYNQNTRTMIQIIENILLEQSLAKKEGVA